MEAVDGDPNDRRLPHTAATPTSKERSMRTNSPTPQKSTSSALASSLTTAARDVYQGFIHTTQNGLALLGIAGLKFCQLGGQLDPTAGIIGLE